MNIANKMAIKYLFMLICVIVNLVSCQKSFTLVLDTTVSMREDIDVIKANLGSVVNGNITDIENYIIVPFKDPDVGAPLLSTTPKDFLSSLNAVTTSGGVDCPENSLAGIERALLVSKPESYIYVFTDAYAKDYNSISSIESLCRNTHSQVVVFLSGSCLPSKTSRTGNVDVYYDITKACSGAVFHFHIANLREAFRYMKEMMKVEWSDIRTESFSGHKELTGNIVMKTICPRIFLRRASPLTHTMWGTQVDLYTTDFMIAVSGNSPVLDIVDSTGQVLSVEKIVDTRQSLVVGLINPETRTYKAKIDCQGTTSVTLYIRNHLPFQYGFSTKAPRSLQETSLRPMPDSTNYILISVSDSIRLNAAELQVLGENGNKILRLDENLGYYITDAFIEPGKLYRIWVNGQDTTNYIDVKGSTKILIPQKSVTNAIRKKPISKIIEPVTKIIDFGNNITLSCKVTGYPKPNIRWEDETGLMLPSEDFVLEMPYVHLSYVAIQNATKNCTIFCKCENSEGEDSQSMELFVNRTFSFDVIKIPRDKAIEYGNDDKLYCEVNAYPEANIKWYHNDTIIEISDNLQVLPEENALLIKEMNLENAGIYKCEVANVVNNKTFSAIVTVSGIEAARIKIDNEEIISKPGDFINLECRVIQGKPPPIITWLYKSNDSYTFNNIPDGVFNDNGKLKIASVQTEHRGSYRCTAENMLGQESRDVTIKVQYSPIIKNNEVEIITVKEGVYVQLPCEVESSPKATVRWEMSQDDVIIHLDERHSTDYHNTHRFEATLRDSGNYHCIAENDIGRAEKTIMLNVLVPPYIEPPKSETVSVNVGETVQLVCNVLFGNPSPSVKWEFVGMDSTTTVLKRSNLTDSLFLRKVSQANEGSYICIVENDVGIDRIKYQLKIRQ